MRFVKKLEIAKLNEQMLAGRECRSNGTVKSSEASPADCKPGTENVKAKTGIQGNGSEKGQRNEEKTVEGVKETLKETRGERFHSDLGIDNKVMESEEITSNNSRSTETTLEKDESNQKRRYSCWQNCRGKISQALNHPNVIHWVAICLIGLTVWGIIYSVAGTEFMPGTQLFSLLFLFVLAFVSGEIVKLFKLPPLLGMLLMGLLLRNVGFIHLKGTYVHVAASLREMALCIILIRAGLGLDPTALKTLKYVILRVAFIPGLVEGIITTIVTHFLLGLPWLWGMLLGAILAAVSPAVVIPCLFSLQERGYGKSKGIPTMVVAAASLDDIFAITVFGVILNVIYSTGTSVTMQIAQGPCGILLGIAFGLVWGFVAHFVPHEKDDQVVLLRVLFIIGGGLMAIVGSGAIGYQGAGPLGCITAAYVACLGWRKQDYTGDHNPVADVFRIIWLVFQPILFSLIGSEVDVSVLEASTIGNGILALFCSLLGRIVVSVFVGYGAGFSWREKLFIAWAWFPKATVQAALGPLALDIARKNGTEEDIIHAGKILILAVLAILITAPIGAALITILGPRLLSKEEESTTVQKKMDDVNLEPRHEENGES